MGTYGTIGFKWVRSRGSHDLNWLKGSNSSNVLHGVINLND